MDPGRTPKWNVIADIEPTAWLEAVRLTSADRLALPVALRRRVSWCAPPASLPLLAIVGVAGDVTIAPMSDRAEELEAIKIVLEGAEFDERPTLAFVAMATYSQISLQPDGRLRLSPMLTLHLGAASGNLIWVAAHSDLVTLWSERDWAAQLEQGSLSLRDQVAMARTHA